MKFLHALQIVLDAIRFRENSLFVLMGDHGMTEEGNHGGATVEETHSAIFFYSPHRAFTDSLKGEKNRSSQTLERHSIFQTDLVSHLLF